MGRNAQDTQFAAVIELNLPEHEICNDLLVWNPRVEVDGKVIIEGKVLQV